MEQDQNLRLRKKSNQSGQAVVEYVLLLVIVVSIAVGISKGFSSLNDYLKRYIGDYIACLMEYGELPSLGIADASLNRHAGGIGKKCNQQYAAFTFDEGRPSTDGGSGGGGSGGNGGGGGGNGGNNNGKGSTSGKDGANKDSQSASSGDKKSSSASNSGKNSDSDKNASDSGNGNGSDKFGNGGGSGSKKSPYSNGQIARTGSRFGTSDGGDADSQKVRITDDEDSEKSGKKKEDKKTSSSRFGGNDDRYRAITGGMQEEYEKEVKNKIVRGPTSTVKTIASGTRFGPFKKEFTPPPFKKTVVKEDDTSGFSFGYFLRWIMIAGIVIAIIIFFGGQIMNYSNSQE